MNAVRLNILTIELNRIIKNIVEKYSPLKIILFGSVATGNVEEWSDIDLIVIKDTSKTFYERLEEIVEIAEPNVGADIIVYTPEEEDHMKNDLFYKEEIMKKGKVIFDVQQQMA